MVSMSTLVGTIPTQNKEVFRSDTNEVLYKLKASFAGVDIPVVVSSFNWKDDLWGKVRVQGYLDTDKEEDGSYSMFLYCHTIEGVPVDEPESNEITLYARITKVKPLYPTSRGVDIRKFVTTQTTHTRKTVVITVVAKKLAARAMGTYKKGDYIKGVGHLYRYKKGYSVIFDTVPEDLQKEDMSNG